MKIFCDQCWLYITESENTIPVTLVVEGERVGLCRECAKKQNRLGQKYVESDGPIDWFAGWGKYRWLAPWAWTSLLAFMLFLWILRPTELWYFGILDWLNETIGEAIGDLVVLVYVGFPLIMVALLIYIAYKLSDRSNSG